MKVINGQFYRIKEAVISKTRTLKYLGNQYTCIEEWELPYPMEQKIVLN